MKKENITDFPQDYEYQVFTWVIFFVYEYLV